VEEPGGGGRSVRACSTKLKGCCRRHRLQALALELPPCCRHVPFIVHNCQDTFTMLMQAACRSCKPQHCLHLDYMMNQQQLPTHHSCLLLLLACNNAGPLLPLLTPTVPLASTTS
jgi:hypothetical protein